MFSITVIGVSYAVSYIPFLLVFSRLLVVCQSVLRVFLKRF